MKVRPNRILLRYGELFLKGKNKCIFENRLVCNLKKICGLNINVKKINGRLVTDYFSNHRSLKRVFGLVSYSPAIKVKKELEEIKSLALGLLRERSGTFKIETKRSDKSFPLKSLEINQEVGKFIEANTSLIFNSRQPELFLGIEINLDGAYLFLEIIPCFGGLPTGVEGKAILLLENEASVLAGLSFMRRGCRIIPVSFGYGEVSLLQQFNPDLMELKVVKDWKELFGFAEKSKIKVMVSGQNFDNYSRISSELLMFRPLIAFNEAKISRQLKEFSSV